MKEFHYNNSISSFFIDYYENSIIIIPCGAESPFEHINMINSIICNLPIKRNAKVYFDLVLIHGSIENRFMVMDYIANQRKINILKNKKLLFSNLPKSIKEIVSNFYTYNMSKQISKSVLTDFEKASIKNALVAV